MLFEFVETKRKETRGRSYVVDDHIKICPECNRSWEYVNRRIHSVSHMIYPAGVIPKYGKEKLPCPECK